MIVTIIKDSGKIAFQGKVSSLEELKSIYHRIKQTDEELGYSFTYDIPEAKDFIKKVLLDLEKQRLQEVLHQYGYISLADVQLYANQNDDEAQKILNWYKSYDDGIWQYINNDLQTFTIVDEFLSLDMKAIEEQIYQDLITASPLP